ncbi:MAG: GNAT family N-acetyltransferase [Alkalibacterium sp.]|nr:GNAT family N-acetyltransferase [Alkalibacterium sp.]
MNFNTLYTYSAPLDQNDFFIQYYNPNALFRYDSNFFELLYSPSVEEFKLIEDMHWQFSLDYSLTHVKFIWPQDQGILLRTLDYLSQEAYGLEKLELYSITPQAFKGTPNKDVVIETVDSSTLQTFKAINYVEDLESSKSFAEKKQSFYDLIFDDSAVTLRLAYLNSIPVGCCITIEQSQTIEIDDLFTLPDYRGARIAGTLQSAVMSAAFNSDKKVILAADAEDSPKEMYIKQGYCYEGFRIGAIKRLKEETE